MTCIAGIAHEGQVYIGGDSAGICTSDLSLTVRSDPKLFSTGPYVFGFAGSFRMGQILRYVFVPPDPDIRDLDRFMCVDFVDALRDCLKSGGFARTDEGVESGGLFLVGVCGRLFRVSSDYQVGESLDGFDAIGCGDLIALGSIFSTVGLPPERRLCIALQAAERHSAGVRGPFRYVSTR